MSLIKTPLIEKQAQLKTQLSALIEHVVSFGSDEAQLDKLSQQIQAIEAQLNKAPRPIAHFNNHLASSEPNFALPYSPICGPLNPVAPPLKLEFNAHESALYAYLNCPKTYEGPKGLIHGGIIAAIYDQILAMLTTCLNRPSYTAYLNVQYKKPTPLYQDLVFKAFVEKMEGKKAFIKGQCLFQDEILTEAEGLFIRAPETGA